MYIQLIIVLLSLIVVLIVLILHIVKQTLAFKAQYEQAKQAQPAPDQLWIDRKESVDVLGSVG